MAEKNIVFSTVPFGGDLSATESAWNPFHALPALQNFAIHKLYLFIPFSLRGRMPGLAQAFAASAPQMEVETVPVLLNKDFSPTSMGDFYCYFNDYFTAFPFRPEEEKYFIHFAPGNSFSHSFMFTLLINLRKLPIRLLQLRQGPTGTIGEVYDCAINTWVAEIARREMDRSDPQEFLKSSIKTRNPDFNRLIGEIEQAAINSEAPVLLVGATGSGKSRLARRIYELRHMRGMAKGKFVEVNCATLSRESAQSMLFGHVRGAFTGAIANRKGFVAQADKGILFLDEIGELSEDMQILLLKVIEEKTFIPFGADAPARSDFQLICATNRDLERDCLEGRFRLDLLSRINLWEFHLPSLRDRPEDIEPNLDYELQRITASRGMVAQFIGEAKQRFLEFAESPEAIWPGNFRSLSASLERMATYAPRCQIDADVVAREIARLRAMWRPLREQGGFPLLQSLLADHDRLDLFEKLQLEGVLEVCLKSASRSEAGRALFGVSRQGKTTLDDTTRLRKYLAGYGIAWESIKEALAGARTGGGRRGPFPG